MAKEKGSSMNTNNISQVEDYLIALLDVARNKKVEIYNDQIHKIFFLLENEKRVNLGLNFIPDLYGPFSPDLNGILVNLIQKGIVKDNIRKSNHISFERLVLGRTRTYELIGNYSVNVSDEIKRFFEDQISKNTKEVLKEFSTEYKQCTKILEVIEKILKENKKLSKVIGKGKELSEILEIEEDTISSYIKDAIVDLEIAELIKNDIPSEDKEKENRMLFCLASSAEKFTKALLPLFIMMILNNVSLFVNLEDLFADTNKSSLLDRIVGKANLIMLIAFNVNKLRKVGHEPISNLELDKLLEDIKELLPNELRSLHEVYDEIIHYMKQKGNEPNKRRYDDIAKIIDKINNVLDLSNLRDHLEGWLADIYRSKDPNSLDEIVNTHAYISKKMLEGILYMLYSEHAAGSITRYSVGRSKDDEEYLEDLRKHKNQIFEFLEKEKKLTEELLMTSKSNP